MVHTAASLDFISKAMWKKKNFFKVDKPQGHSFPVQMYWIAYCKYGTSCCNNNKNNLPANKCKVSTLILVHTDKCSGSINFKMS